MDNLSSWVNSSTTASASNGLYTMTTAEIVLWCVLYAAIAILAVVGNLITMYIIVRNAEMRTVTNIFILNLAASDTITGIVVIPFKFQAALLQRWNLPSFLCQLVPFIETVSLTVSVLTLCATAVDRYRAVSMKGMAKKRDALMLILLSWLVSVLLSSPIGIYHQVVTAPNGAKYCMPTAGHTRWWKVYNIYLALVQYLVPLLIVVGTFVGIAIRMKQNTVFMGENMDDDSKALKGFHKAMRKVIIMLSIVVAAFAFCWLPLEIYLVLSELVPIVNDFYYINILFFVFHWLAMCNSCLNPLIFWFFHERFRREYKGLVYQLLCRKVAYSPPHVNQESLMVLGTLSQQLVRSQRSRRSSVRKRAISLYHFQNYFMSELGMDMPTPPQDTPSRSTSASRERIYSIKGMERKNKMRLKDRAKSLQEDRYLSMALKFTYPIPADPEPDAVSCHEQDELL